MSKERWFTLTISGSIDEDVELEGAPDIDSFIMDFFGELVRDGVLEHPIRVGDIEMLESFSTETMSLMCPSCPHYLSGVIEKAAWQVDVTQRKPYVLIGIRTRERIPRVLYKAMAIIIPIMPWMISPMNILNKIAGTELMVPVSGSIEIGSTIPELIGREVMFRIEETIIRGDLRPYIVDLQPIKEDS